MLSKKLLKELSAFNSTEISDALDACQVEGALSSINPISPGVKLIGEAYTVRYEPYAQKPNEFKGAANYIDKVPPHAVIVIDNGGRTECTTWGEILTHVALQKQIAGTVVFGAVRDVGFIRQSNYPVFACGIYMRSGKNRVYMAEEQCPLTIQGISIKPLDIVFGDENGVLVIPKDLLLDVIHKAKNIKRTEKEIIAAVDAGATLAKAREDHLYHMPWVKKNG